MHILLMFMVKQNSINNALGHYRSYFAPKYSPAANPASAPAIRLFSYNIAPAAPPTAANIAACSNELTCLLISPSIVLTRGAVDFSINDDRTLVNADEPASEGVLGAPTEGSEGDCFVGGAAVAEEDSSNPDRSGILRPFSEILCTTPPTAETTPLRGFLKGIVVC